MAILDIIFCARDEIGCFIFPTNSAVRQAVQERECAYNSARFHLRPPQFS